MIKPISLPRRDGAGFTLIELVTVMLIIGIMAFVVLPRFDLLRGYDEIGYRDQVKATLEYARKSAVAQRRNVHVTIVANIISVNIASDIPEGAAASTFDRNLTLPGRSNNFITAPDGVSINPLTIVNFDALGRPTNLAANLTLTVSGDGGTITVEAETGYVH